jgi:hypothetical protein
LRISALFIEEMWFWGEMAWLDCSLYFYCLFFHKYQWVAFKVFS